jgi:hypothetical protein
VKIPSTLSIAFPRLEKMGALISEETGGNPPRPIIVMVSTLPRTPKGV